MSVSLVCPGQRHHSDIAQPIASVGTRSSISCHHILDGTASNDMPLACRWTSTAGFRTPPIGSRRARKTTQDSRTSSSHRDHRSRHDEKSIARGSGHPASHRPLSDTITVENDIRLPHVPPPALTIADSCNQPLQVRAARRTNLKTSTRETRRPMMGQASRLRGAQGTRPGPIDMT